MLLTVFIKIQIHQKKKKNENIVYETKTFPILAKLKYSVGLLLSSCIGIGIEHRLGFLSTNIQVHISCKSEYPSRQDY